MSSGFGENPRCIAQTAEDRQCKNDAKNGSEYCSRHDPKRVEERSEAARRAALTRKMGTLTLSQETAQVKAQLRTLTEELRAEGVPPAVGAVIIQSWNTILRAIELERRVIEQEEFLPMLHELQEDVKRRKKSHSNTNRW